MESAVGTGWTRSTGRLPGAKESRSAASSCTLIGPKPEPQYSSGVPVRGSSNCIGSMFTKLGPHRSGRPTSVNGPSGRAAVATARHGLPPFSLAEKYRK